LANSGDFPEKITLMSSSYTVSYYTSFTAKPEEPGLYIADSALYSADNLKKLTGIKWLCCVPKTIKSVQDLLTELASEQFITTD
jgi:transposase